MSTSNKICEVSYSITLPSLTVGVGLMDGGDRVRSSLEMGNLGGGNKLK